MSLFVFVIGVWARSGYSAAFRDNPGGVQQVAEMLITNPVGFGIRDLLAMKCKARRTALHGDDWIGFRVHFALLICLAFSRHFSAPTAEKAVPLGCAIVIFSVFQLAGNSPSWCWALLAYICWRTQEVGRLAAGHSAFPVELISTSARILSLTVRLWANILPATCSM